MNAMTSPGERAERSRLIIMDEAEKRCEYERLKKRADMIYAEMFHHYRQGGASVKDAEAQAEISKPHRDAVEEYTVAHALWRAAAAEAKALDMRFDTWRTMEASRRAELNKLGG